MVFSNLQLFAAIAAVLAPSSVVWFTYIDLHLFGIHINKYNFIGIFMAIVIVLYTVACAIFLPNCTLHPGYQIFLHKIKKKAVSSKVSSITERSTREDGTKGSEKQIIHVPPTTSTKDNNQTTSRANQGSKETTIKPSVTHTAKLTKEIRTEPSLKHTTKDLLNATKLIMTADFALIITTCFAAGFLFTETETMINLIAVYIFKWELSLLSVVSTCCVVVNIATMKFVQRYRGIDNIYFLLMCCFE